jgi:SulP family sulfate permease
MLVGFAFIANADALRDAVRAHAFRDGIRAVVLDAETIPHVDVTAAGMLVQLSDDLQRRGVELVMARDIGQVRDVLGRTEQGGPLLTACPTVHQAVEALQAPPG